MTYLTHMVWLFCLLGEPKILQYSVYAGMPCQGQVSLSNHWQVIPWNIGEKKMSLPHYFSVIRFSPRSYFMSHKPLSYGTSSHLTQCSNEELSCEAATKERSSSDPCWVFGTAGLSASQAHVTRNVCSGPNYPSLQKKELIFSPALQSV